MSTFPPLSHTAVSPTDKKHSSPQATPLVDLMWHRGCDARGKSFQFLFNEITKRDIEQSSALLLQLNNTQLLSLTPSDLFPLIENDNKLVADIGEAFSYRLTQQLNWSWVDTPPTPAPSFGPPATLDHFLRRLWNEDTEIATQVFQLLTPTECTHLTQTTLIQLLQSPQPDVRKRALRWLAHQGKKL